MTQSTQIRRQRRAGLTWLWAAMAGVSGLLSWAAWAELGSAASPLAILLVAVVGGVPLGLATLLLAGVLLRTGGRWLGGRAGAAAVRAAIGRGLAPAAWGLLLWAAQLALLPAASFGSGQVDQPMRLLALGCELIHSGLWLWAAVRVVRGLSVAHGFGVVRAVAALLLAALIVVGAALAVLALAALAIGLRGG